MASLYIRSVQLCCVQCPFPVGGCLPDKHLIQLSNASVLSVIGVSHSGFLRLSPILCKTSRLYLDQCSLPIPPGQVAQGLQWRSVWSAFQSKASSTHFPSPRVPQAQCGKLHISAELEGSLATPGHTSPGFLQRLHQVISYCSSSAAGGPEKITRPRLD